MNEADAYTGRVRRAGTECLCVMDVMVMLVSVSVVGVVVDKEVDVLLSNEMRECDG